MGLSPQRNRGLVFVSSSLLYPRGGRSERAGPMPQYRFLAEHRSAAQGEKRAARGAGYRALGGLRGTVARRKRGRGGAGVPTEAREGPQGRGGLGVVEAAEKARVVRCVER